MGVVEEETEEEEDVTGDGVNDELDCSGIVIGVVVKITVDEDGGEFEELDSVGKENDSEVEVDVVVGVETVVELLAILGRFHHEAGIGCDATSSMRDIIEIGRS